MVNDNGILRMVYTRIGRDGGSYLHETHMEISSVVVSTWAGRAARPGAAGGGTSCVKRFHWAILRWPARKATTDGRHRITVASLVAWRS
ncbi:hypothetical protein [Streptomyces sp. NPDC058644]|uniref:hypothetical protein n=1 Tax=unclassified Streptomyces TaxID=2593676 RepID=UPI003662D2A1